MDWPEPCYHLRTMVLELWFHFCGPRNICAGIKEWKNNLQDCKIITLSFWVDNLPTCVTMEKHTFVISHTLGVCRGFLVCEQISDSSGPERSNIWN